MMLGLALRASFASTWQRTSTTARSGGIKLERSGYLVRAPRRVAADREDRGGAGGQQWRQPPSSPIETAVHAVDRVLEIVRLQQLEELVTFLPEHVVAAAAAAAAAKAPAAPPRPVTFSDALETMQLKHPDQQVLDTFAIRQLVFSVPVALRPLSAFGVSADKRAARFAVTSVSGEESVLTFTVLRRPAEDMRHACAMLQPWMLVSVHGEAAHDSRTVCAHGPSPEWSPEAVVAAQLQALSDGDIGAVYAFAAPQNRAVTGPLDRFATILKKDRRYSALLHLEGSESLRRCQFQEHTYLEVVRVSGRGGGQDSLYCWILTLLPEDGGPLAGCWMVQYVQLMSDDLRLMRLLSG